MFGSCGEIRFSGLVVSAFGTDVVLVNCIRYTIYVMKSKSILVKI